MLIHTAYNKGYSEIIMEWSSEYVNFNGLLL
jgi:hypothetical protein